MSMWDLLKVWVHAHRCDELGPTGPMHLPSLGRRLHSSMVERRISSTEIILVTTPCEKRKTFQEAWLGRGNKELYREAKAVSVVHSHLALLPNEREGMSVI